MQETKSIIDAIRSYILLCPLLKDGHVNVDYLENNMGYSIDPLPANPVLQVYTDGGKKKQYQFAFTSKERFDGDSRTAIENSGFYEEFGDWIETNNRKEILPELPEGKESLKIEVMTGGYLFETDADLARYQIQCRLIYYQEAGK